MKKIFKNARLGTVLAITFFMAFCSKPNIKDTSDFPKEDVISRDGEEDICTVEKIDTIKLGVTIVDGMLSFSDHASMIDALDILFSHRLEEIIEWQNRVGFTSLFSEYARIDALGRSAMVTELTGLTSGRLNKIMSIRSDTTLAMQLYNLYISRILNTDGLVKVSGYVGTIGDKINMWTIPSKKSTLISALNSGVAPTDGDIIVNDGRFFSPVNGEAGDRSDVVLYNSECPADASIGHHLDGQQVSSGDNRRIDAHFDLMDITTEGSGGNKNYTSKFIIATTSKKGKKNTYNTDHYWSYNFKTTTFVPFATVQLWTGKGQNDCTKYGGKTVTILSLSNVTQSYLIANGIRLVEVIPGTSGGGQTGTAASHRGMNGEYIRWDCD